jgi:acetyl-CoA synthetase
MTAPHKVEIDAKFAAHALITPESFKQLSRQASFAPEAFWSQAADRLQWIKKWDTVKKTTFQKPVSIAWYEGGELNVSVNCLDRHLAKRGDKVALIWEPDDASAPALKYTYKQLHMMTCKFANVLKKNGVKKGDRVTLYMPMIPMTAVAMLACARIGAIHSVVFAGFAPEAIADRILDAKSDFVITTDEGLRGGKKIPLKKNIDTALQKVQGVRQVLVVRHTGAEVSMEADRDKWYDEEEKTVSSLCPAEKMLSEDPLFMLYTSGSTNRPKGVLHTTAGYLVYASFTHEIVFDHKENDTYWCTADLGWITGHSYVLYGPLANGATTLMFEGVPTYPDASRFWQVIDRHQVSVFYTAPTAIRALMAQGNEWVKKASLQSLRLLGSVGEPINPEAWWWYHQIVGHARCPVVDTWWQTETGGILISALPGAVALKPGSAAFPMFGIQPKMLNLEGKEILGAGEGVLVLADSWPGQMRTVYGDHKRFEDTYFSTYPGYYFTGDGCRRDEDGYWWITGRVDDVINVSGHRIGTAELESALVGHPKVAEAAVVGYSHDIKGQGIYAYVILKTEFVGSDDLKSELISLVAQEIGAFAKPDFLKWAPGLPKTRSGKIMRRILRKIAEGQTEDFGDTSTLADPSVVQELIKL